MRGPRFPGQAIRHEEFREWAEAALGDPRQVYARRAEARLNDPLVFMPEGEALEFREDAKSGALICPVPECQAPELTTRHCEDRRDHFMHSGRSMTDETHGGKYRELVTRRLLHEWAVRQSRVAEVFEEVEVGGVPIALLAHLHDGSAVALCHVDGRLGADAWEERNRALRSKGLATAWIFALRAMYFDLPHPAEPATVDRTDLILDKAIYRRMRGRGAWPLLINLERQEFANLVKPGGVPARRLKLVPPDLDRVVHFVRCQMAACRLCPYGIETPAIREFTLRGTSLHWDR